LAAPATRVTVTYNTIYNIEFKVSFYVGPGVVDPNNAAVQAIVTAINNVTRAVAIRIELTASSPNTVTATANAVYVNEDKLEFVFQGAESAHTFKLPGLDPSLLEDDDETVDCTAGDPAAYVAAVMAGALDAAGNALTSGPDIARRRTARKMLKK